MSVLTSARPGIARAGLTVPGRLVWGGGVDITAIVAATKTWAQATAAATQDNGKTIGVTIRDRGT